MTTLLVCTVCCFWAGGAGAADAIPGEEFCNRPVDNIVFSGNNVTKPQVMLRELNQQQGQPCSIDDIVDSTQGVMDLGLFKSVLADLSLVDDQLQLRFTVVEKLYYLVIPRISRTSDGEIRGGAQLRLDNFLGRLHQVKITSEKRKEDDGDGPGGFVHKLNYNIPRFFGSNHGFGFNVFTDRRQQELSKDRIEFGMAQSETEGISMQFSRWLNSTRGVQGVRYYFGFDLRRRTLSPLSGELGPFQGGRDSVLIVGMETKQIHRDLYRRRGTVYGAQFSFANESTGSDFEYSRADFFATFYLPLSGAIRNLNVQSRIGFSNGSAFGESSYHIGGGEVLRGMQPNRRGGDVLALVNIEYLQGWFTRPAWRWAVFSDIGNVYQRNRINLAKLHARAGVGLRWKFESLSNTDLRLDVAWDPELDKAKVYFSSNLTF